MTAAVLTRHPLAMPGPADGAFMARHLDPRPCVTNPPQWWDTGNEGNATAVELCRQCPLVDACKPGEDEDVAGTIRAGVAYDDQNKPTTTCDTCHMPMLRRNGWPVCVNGHGSVAAHHTLIANMRKQGKPFEEIGAAIGCSGSAVNRYWTQHLTRTGQKEVRIDRLPGIDENSRNRAQDFHDHVFAMLSDLDAKYTYEEVAYAIGSTTDSVKSYWRRVQRQRELAGLPTFSRRLVSNRGGRHRKAAA